MPLPRFLNSRRLFTLAIVFVVNFSAVRAQTVVFAQPGFPVIGSEPVSRATLATALGSTPLFATVDQLRSGDVLQSASLLVLPYGSVFPADAWPSILHYLQHGGNLLMLGGQPLRVPVLGDRDGAFTVELPQDSYSRAIGIRHTYAVPADFSQSHFHWRPGYDFLPATAISATRVFAEEGRLQGLGYLDAEDGTHLAAPVIVIDPPSNSGLAGSRVVALPFTPAAGYWASTDGIALLRAAANYARAGAASLQIELLYSAIRPGEPPQIALHLRLPRNAPPNGSFDLQLREGNKELQRAHLLASAIDFATSAPFHDPLPPGVYTVRATWTPQDSTLPQEFAENGFDVEDLSALDTGDALGVGSANAETDGNFLTLGGKPFFPVGTNYFTTEENGWDFSGPRNAAVWEHDFADMQRHNVNFVRTGVWTGAGKFLDPATGGANERFLRNLEAFLAAAHRHNIAVNFTFFAFTPRTSQSRPPSSGTADASPPSPNPYLNPAAVQAEKKYVASIVDRFGKVPWLTYDLINEPSFSNPRNIFHGNIPNGDPDERAAWDAWLQKRYASLASLADAWRTTPIELGDWQSIPLPKPADLTYERSGNPDQVRAFDYNLFAQQMFFDWVHGIVAAIHAAGSHQLINVGQDEGGVTNRLLNQFYATAGVSFTTNHTYWQDDALLWDSVAAKRPGMPNITGETGYQPAWDPDGTWRYDELTGAPIMERKWALGFAAGSSGALQWDWAREIDFGMQRSDGSAKIWESMMRDLGGFARQAAPYATGLTLPDVALVLPQSLQLSTRNSQAVEAQQTAVRVLYQYSRVEVYAVGEYQMDTLGTPKLIVLPSAYGLSDQAWAAIEARVRAGAVLLISGPFSGDEHMHLTDRARKLGIDATPIPLQLRDEILHAPQGDLPLQYRGMATTLLDRNTLPGGRNFVELPLGKGKVLFSTLPLELNSDFASIAAVYADALETAGVARTYTTAVSNPGVLICPTRLPHATLYVLTSETETTTVSFTDTRSGKLFSGRLSAGRAALLLVGERGQLLTSYGWNRGR
jgi:hypothetical protein